MRIILVGYLARVARATTRSQDKKTVDEIAAAGAVLVLA